MADYDTIRIAFANRLSSGYSTTPIVWDNSHFEQQQSSWIRATLIPSDVENTTLGTLRKRFNGLFWIQIFVPLKTGTSQAYQIAKEIDLLFANVEFSNIVCYTANTTRSGDTGDGWYQLNVRVNFWSNE
jgi:hypothetical protein